MRSQDLCICIMTALETILKIRRCRRVNQYFMYNNRICVVQRICIIVSPYDSLHWIIWTKSLFMLSIANEKSSSRQVCIFEGRLHKGVRRRKLM